MKLVLATGNKGKIREFQVAFGHRGIECIGIKDVCDVPEPEETGTSFMENAILKATYYMQACGLPCIADDSGLAVDALNGEPGIYSARYAGHDGEHGDDDANNKKLVANLQGIPFESRTAHYVAALALAVPDADSAHKQWSDFAKRYGETLSRIHDLPGKDGGERLAKIRDRVEAIQTLSDERLQAWVAARHYADLILQPAIKGPVMVHHIPRFLRQRRSAGEAKVALLVFDGMAFDQWVRIREHLIARQQPLAFDENTAFAWLPTVTSVSRQALFSGLRPREFEDSIDANH